MRHPVLAVMLVLGLLAPFAPMPLSSSPALAQSTHQEKKPFDPHGALEDATRQLLRTLELFFNAIPQYAPPEVLENGDIIIRRLNPKPDKPGPEKPGPAPNRDGDADQTRT